MKRLTLALLLTALLPACAVPESGRVSGDRAPSSATSETNPPNAQPTTPYPSAGARFYFSGNGRLKLSHGHFDTKLDVRYRRADRSYDQQALQQIRRFFRSREDGRESSISLRTIELLSYVQTRFHPKEMTLMSGYRSPEYNAALGERGAAVAMASLHTQSLAADIAFVGVDIRKLWLQLRELQVGGVGFYKTQNFLHIDSGPSRFWEETTSKVKDNISAGNARIFVRTDFDRYATLEGAVLRLHSVTTLPLYVRATADLGGATLTLQPVDDEIPLRDGCWAIVKPSETYEFRITHVDGSTPRGPHEITLFTCDERVEKTPPEVQSNPIDFSKLR